MNQVISVNQLGKDYATAAGTFVALKSVSLTIAQGEFVAIMGPSGSGKSTFMNLLGCLDYPTRGSYALDGVGVATLSSDALAALRNRVIGFVFQGFNLLPRLNARENVALPMLYKGASSAERARRADEMLVKVGLAGLGDRRPNQLSGGQQQRVAIARALCNAPRLILADEPTGNLDSHTSDEVMNLFTELNNTGITIVLVTHEPDIARYAKRLVRFKDGEMIYDGDPAGGLI
ncbi:MAG: ABC transporter ATP-binding protein [Sulfuriferula sp.]|nr:ABC transporter ATP-binding protein [Sulfuriferula sp.]